MNILLVSPQTPSTFWSFRYVMQFVSRRAAFPPLGLITVAAMLPRDWNLKLVDLNVTTLSDCDIEWADYVFLSGMIVQADSCHRVLARCSAKGTPVVAGGPLFTTGHERFPEVSHFVLGEAEDVIDELVADLQRGEVKRIYQSEQRPNLAKTPIPRWDLLDMRKYATMSVQYSRGCPFDCEFCDIIVMYGRQPRTKSPAQIIAELDALLDAGWNDGVFVVDDNFIGHKPRAKALLREIIEWRHRRRTNIVFLTEASLNMADDDELLLLMSRAGFKRVFVGIESPQEESLLECSKAQNTRRDMTESVRKIHRAGIEVMGGFIVGFDSDKPDIFERQKRLIENAGIVTAMVGLLTALPGTKLFTRLMNEGRLLAQSSGNNTEATVNFVPKLDREMLINGYRRLVQNLYAPRAYYERIAAFLRDYRPRGPRVRVNFRDAMAFVRSLWIMGVATKGRREYWKFLARSLLLHPRALPEAISLAIMGHHFRRVALGL